MWRYSAGEEMPNPGKVLQKFKSIFERVQEYMREYIKQSYLRKAIDIVRTDVCNGIVE